VSLVDKRSDALVVSPDSFFANRRVQFTTLAAYHRLPAIYPQREFPEVGGMMSYGANIADQLRQVGLYAGRIVKGVAAIGVAIRTSPVVGSARNSISFTPCLNSSKAATLRLMRARP